MQCLPAALKIQRPLCCCLAINCNLPQRILGLSASSLLATAVNACLCCKPQMACSTAAGQVVPTDTPPVGVREHYPAASSSQDNYTLLKFYDLSTDLLKAVLKVRLLHAVCYAHCCICPLCFPTVCEQTVTARALQVQKCFCIGCSFWLNPSC